MEDKWPHNNQVDDFRPKKTEDEQQRDQLGPRGVRGKSDSAKMTPQRKKKTPDNAEGGHTA